MYEEKQAQLNHYLDLTVRVLEALKQGAEEKVPELIGQREECITAINRLDEKAGKPLMNEFIRRILNQLLSLEEEIKPELQRVMREMSSRNRNEQNNQFVKRQYEDWQAVPKGVFYDRRK
ncbi:flagellar protein FliT [Neobacillus sp. Marseille-QA0830]